MADEMKSQIKRTWKPVIAGALDIIGCLVCVITGYNINAGCTDGTSFVIFFSLALLAVAGGIFSFSRTAWGLAIVGPIGLLLGLGCAIMSLIIYVVVSLFGGMLFGGLDLEPSVLTTLGLATLFLLGLGTSSLILTVACKNEFK